MTIGYRLFLFACVFFINIATSNGQCQIKQEISPTGVNIYTTPFELIYLNNTYSIFAQLKHDGDDFFLVLEGKPISKNTLGGDPLKIILDNEEVLNLDHHDTKFSRKDSTINVLYKLDNKQLPSISKIGIKECVAVIEKTPKNFILVAHKNVLKNQLRCLLNEGGKENEKENESEENKKE